MAASSLDDKGLGKTVQGLGLIATEKAAGRLSGPVLVVAPTSLMANWATEAENSRLSCPFICCTGQTASRISTVSTASIWC